MSLVKSDFTNEAELQKWVGENFSSFYPGTTYVPGCQIHTASGKGGVPDGFAFNFEEKEWYIIEHELLGHGVWPHIAEQITRFVVAIQNPTSRRKIRDHLFAILVKNKNLPQVAKVLDVEMEMILQQIELFIEGVQPEIIIFIDDSNRDLEDFAHSLSLPIRIFRIHKFLVNGEADYYSPDKKEPIISIDGGDFVDESNSEYEIIELLGGGQLHFSSGRFKAYELKDKSIICIKKSKYHQNNNYYWYGIGQVALRYSRAAEITHIVFIMGDEGFVKVPFSIVEKFIKNTKTSQNPDGSVRHYHLVISPGPNPRLYYSASIPSFDISEYYQAF
jgi:hypothetical protein